MLIPWPEKILFQYEIYASWKNFFTSGGILKASPEMVAHHTIKYENTAIQRILPRKEMGKNFLDSCLRVSGSVNHNGRTNGKKQT